MFAKLLEQYELVMLLLMAMSYTSIRTSAQALEILTIGRGLVFSSSYTQSTVLRILYPQSHLIHIMSLERSSIIIPL